MTWDSKQISVRIECPLGAAYAFAAEPTNLPRWASGLGTDLTEQNGTWYVRIPGGARLAVEFAPRNDFGVLDHTVTLPSGEAVYNPMRVFGNDEGCEVVFTLRRTPGMSAEDFERDAGMVQDDLARLKQVLESRVQE